MTTPRPTPYPEPFLPPDPKTAAGSRIADFVHWAARHRGAADDPTDYQALYHLSIPS